MIPAAAPPAKARFIVVGGFLGAGKSAAIRRLGELLKQKGMQIGIITHDEGTERVDSVQFRAAGFDVEEISGGGFEAPPRDLLKAAGNLRARGASIIFVEGCGASAGLRGSVIEPLRKDDSGGNDIAPLSVMVDAVRAARLLRLDSGATFSEKLGYVFRKQVEEAEIVVFNRCDLLPKAVVTQMREALREVNPDATAFTISPADTRGLDEWLECLMTREHVPAAAAGALDPAIVSDAEARLSWLNCTIKVSSVKYFDAEKLLTELTTTIQSLARQDSFEIAHLKTVLRATNDATDELETAVMNLVRNDASPELSGRIGDPVQRAELILNLRAEAKAERLHAVVNQGVLEIMERKPELFARMENCEHFSRARRV